MYRLRCVSISTYLVVDVFALRRPSGLQDVVVVAVVNDEDPAWSDHAGDVLKGQLLVTLVHYEQQQDHIQLTGSNPAFKR